MATEAQQKAITIRDYIHQPHVVKQLEAALPSFLTAERFLRTFYTAMLRNPKLFDCTKESLLSAMIESAQLGLEPILGKAALIPYGKEVQFQPMYRGLIDLARRTGGVKVTAHVVYSKDEFEIEYGDNEKCYHKPYLQGDRGEKLGAYTVWTFDSGMQSFLFLPMSDILEVRDKYSKSWQQSGKDSVWGKSEAEMSKKTVIKNHFKLQPCSIEMERAAELDNRVEIGESQRDLLGQFEYPAGTPPKPESEDEGPAQQLIDKFDVKVSEKEDVNLEKLSEYLALCAKSREGATVNDVKASAIRKGFDDFWGFYGDWLKSQPAGKKDDEDPIRKDFINLGWKSFKAWFLKHQAAIPGMRLETQKEIKDKWLRMSDDPYPLDMAKEGLAEGPWPCPKCGGDAWHRDGCPDKEEPKTPTGPDPNFQAKEDVPKDVPPDSMNSYGEGMSQKTEESEDEKILRMVEGTRMTESGIAIESCPNSVEGISILITKCEGIGMDACESRAGCPNWATYDKS